MHSLALINFLENKVENWCPFLRFSIQKVIFVGFEASQVPTSSKQDSQVFTLDTLEMASQPKVAAPKIKVDKVFELATE